MSEPWELTDEEIEHILLKGIGRPDDTCDYERQFATAAVKKYRDYLASQCGPDPCVGCRIDSPDTCTGKRDANKLYACGPYARYLGQLAMVAKLASQCGPEPCGECKAKGFCDAWGRLTDSQSECCGIYNQYLGTLTGYSKAMQEMEAKLEAERAKAKAEGAWMVVDEMIAFLDCQGHKRPEGV